MTAPKDTLACWMWQDTPIDNHGYAKVWVRGKNRLAKAHRVIYEMLVGPIPAGLTIDHLCRNRVGRQLRERDRFYPIASMREAWDALLADIAGDPMADVVANIAKDHLAAREEIESLRATISELKKKTAPPPPAASDSDATRHAPRGCPLGIACAATVKP